MGAAFTIAAAKIRTRLKAGDKPRQDDWFEGTESHRDAAEELLEGVLLNAADAYEEKKVPLLGNLYASLTFDSTVDRETANFLVGLVPRLTYRQLVLTATIGSGRLGERAATAPPEMEQKVFVNAPPALLNEMQELGVIGVIGFAEPGGWVASPLGTYGGGDVQGWSYSGVVPTAIGKLLFRLALEDEVDILEQDELLSRLIVPSP